MTRTCLIATVKDEAPWLIEWIAHNRAIGFDAIVVASNDCGDGTDRMLDRLAEMGIVTHLPNPAPWEHDRAQLSAYARARRLPEVQSADWLMPMDCDEFLNIHHGAGRLPDLLQAMPPETAAIVVCWRVFGDSGLRDIPEAPLVEKLTRAADERTNRYSVKILFRNDDRFTIIRAHGPHVLGEAGDPPPFTCEVRLADGTPLPPDCLTRPGSNRQLNFLEPELGTWAGAQVNHYMVRTEPAFRLKRLRGNALSGGANVRHYDRKEFRRYNRNEATDTTILRTRTLREEIRRTLMTDPVLARLHREAVAAARQKARGLSPIDPARGLLQGFRDALRRRGEGP